MKIKFGEFEEVEEVTKVKEYLETYFDKVKPDKFESIFVAYPHQCFSSAYEPSKHSPDILEIYMFSLPEALEKYVLIGRQDFIDPFGGNLIALSGNQRDIFRFSLTLDKDFAEIKDTLGCTLAIYKGNQVWILFDLFHRFGVDSSVRKECIEGVLNCITDTLIHPPSEAELEERLLKEIGKTMTSGVTEQIKKLEAEVKTYENDIISHESRTEALLKEYNERQIMLEGLKETKSPNPREMLDKIKAMPIVESVFLQGVMPTIKTKEIKLGPFNYGVWTIGLGKTAPQYTHQVQGKHLHPYEHSGGGFCMGGFQRDYANAMARGQLFKALSIARMEITNYSLATRMHALEPFLTAIMGKDLNKILDKVLTDKFKESDKIFISQIYGLEVTFVGHKDGSETGERVVIKYD